MAAVRSAAAMSAQRELLAEAAPTPPARLWWRTAVVAACLTASVTMAASWRTAGPVAGALLAGALPSHARRAAPGDKGRRGMRDESRIQQETMKVIEKADASFPPHSMVVPLEMAKTTRVRHAVQVVQAEVAASTTATDREEVVVPARTVSAPTGVAHSSAAATEAPKKWNWVYIHTYTYMIYVYVYIHNPLLKSFQPR